MWIAAVHKAESVGDAQSAWTNGKCQGWRGSLLDTNLTGTLEGSSYTEERLTVHFKPQIKACLFHET